MKRKQTKAKEEKARQRKAHGEPLLRRDGRVDPAAVYRAAHKDAPPQLEPPAPQPELELAPAAEPPPDAEGLELEPEALEDDEALSAPPGLGPPGAPAPKVVFTLQRDLAKRLDKYLVDRITFMSRNKLQELITAGGVTVNGRTAKSSTVLREGDLVEVAVPPPPAEDFPAQDIPLDVLYEDEHLIVLNKQVDIIVHPARTHTRGTMINALAFHFRNRSALGGDLSAVGKQFARPGVVHRLDRHTSGAIVFAKSEQAHWQLANQFMARTVDKRYVAVTHGLVEPRIDVIEAPIGPHPSRERGYREKHVIRHDHLGKPAVTIYRVLGHYGQGAGDPGPGEVARPVAAPPLGATAPGWAPPPASPRPPVLGAFPQPSKPADQLGVSLVEVELKTGRTHQIRVHFTHLGYPLVGDDMYGGKPYPLVGGGEIARQALHAAVLQFRHPISGQPMRFVAPLPEDLKALIRSLQAQGQAAEYPSPPGSVLSIAELLG